MINDLYTLLDLVEIDTKPLMDLLGNKTKIKFADICVSCAKDDVDLTVVRNQAEKTFMWWNPGYID